MLPLYLSIEGLYSYQTKQEIDFTSLTAAGLFGIFGKVGSGKSSILEAITFALFGDTNRLNSKNRAYNMLNLNSNQLRIVFHFIGKEGKKYAFEASWRRNGKQFDKVTTIERKAYVFDKDLKIPLESNDAEEILGISYKNFNRTVIVPQGQFKEFLELKGADRSSMMKELFQLEHYDLFFKVASLQKQNELSLQNVQGSLQILEDYTKEEIAVLLTSLKNKEIEAQQLANSYQSLDTQYKKLLAAQELAEELVHKKRDLETLTKEAPAIQQQKEQIQLYQKVERVFKNDLYNLEKEQFKAKKMLTEKEDLTQRVAAIQQQLQQAHLDFDEINIQYSKLDNKKLEVEDLNHILAYQQTSQELAHQAERILKGQTYVDQVEKDLAAISTQIALNNNTFLQLKSKKIDSSLLITINDWYSKREYDQKAIRAVAELLQQKKQAYDAILLFFEQHELELGNWKADFAKKEKEQIQEEERLATALSKAQVQEQLTLYSEQIKDNEPCPLCGSLHHPQIMHAEDVTNIIGSLRTQKEQLSKDQVELRNLKLEFVQAEIKILGIQEELKLNKEKHAQLKADEEAHLAEFIWQEFNPEDSSSFTAWKRGIQKTEEATAAVEKLIADLQLQEAELKNKKDTYTLAVQKIVNEKSTLEGSLKGYQQNIKSLSIADYNKRSKADIQALSRSWMQEIERITADYHSITTHINSLNIDLATATAGTSHVQKLLNDTENAIAEQLLAIEKMLVDHQYQSIAEVQILLAQKLDVAAEESTIKHFEERYALLKSTVTALEQKMASAAVDMTMMEQVKEEFEATKIQQEQVIGFIQSLKDQIVLAQKKYEERLKLELAYDQLRQRANNLTILSNLFKGNGFVDYISTQYLEDLCQLANLRFERLTRGHLKLIINEDNDFEVIDHLNGGKTRSVKTLSGGQFFQASLCLALALAESTRSLNKNDKNFFFIDEGFGTQDLDSVNLIFETLNSLHKENRIVGVISHVDELQERIPASINIVKDDELGSIIFAQS